jgi:hypothetical protein
VVTPRKLRGTHFKRSFYFRNVSKVHDRCYTGQYRYRIRLIAYARNTIDLILIDSSPLMQFGRTILSTSLEQSFSRQRCLINFLAKFPCTVFRTRTLCANEQTMSANATAVQDDVNEENIVKQERIMYSLISVRQALSSRDD